MPGIGILGGTFDPPHYGHLLLAECAFRQLGLEKVLFIPAGDPYRKSSRSVSAPRHRLAMTRLAIAGNPDFEVDPIEVERDGPTYTIDTLKALFLRGETGLTLILGADALEDLPFWRNHEQLQEMARIVVAPKGRSHAEIVEMGGIAGLRESPPIIDMPALDISGTVIRTRVREGMPVRYLLPDPVLFYLEEHGLYTGGDDGDEENPIGELVT